jgi:hypothetical protein
VTTSAIASIAALHHSRGPSRNVSAPRRLRMMIGAETIPDHKFDLLGYTFRPRLSRRRGGKVGFSFSPAASDSALHHVHRPARLDRKRRSAGITHTKHPDPRLA